MAKPGKKTLVIGASENPARYSFMAIHRLAEYQHEVEALGLREGMVRGIPIRTGKPDLRQIDTVTLYIGPDRQPEYYDYILGLKPQRVIFNPGTENEAFEQILRENQIVTEQACTLVMLGTGLY